MSARLRTIAVTGLSVGIVSLAISYTLGGSVVGRILDHDAWHACRDGKASADSGTERRLAWDGSDTVEIALPATVRWRVGEGSEVVVRGSPDVISHVELRRGRLMLNCAWTLMAPATEVVLPGRVFHRVRISGSAKVSIENLNQPDLELDVHGSGNITAQGTVDRLAIAVAGSGNAKLADVSINRLVAKISGSGNVEAAPKDDADIKISGSGNVRLLTRPSHLNTRVSGSGRISQI